MRCKKILTAVPRKTRQAFSALFSLESLRKLRRKNKYLLPYLALALVLIASSVVYSLYGARIFGWQQEVYIQSFSFSLNGNKTGTDNIGTINNEDGTLNLLAKGQEADLTLEVETKGYAVSNFSVPYTVTLRFDDSTGTPNDALARAIEVYAFDNNEYAYIGMLDEFINQGTITLSGGGTATGMSIAGELGINASVAHRYRLVYSLGAGEFYEGTTFSLIAEASYSAPEYTGNTYFVYSAKDLKNAAVNNTDNLTLTLLKDVSMTEDLVFDRKVGINLNGFTLSTGNHTLTIDYDNAYTVADEAFTLEIKDTVGGGTISGNGVFIDAPHDLVLISDTLHALDLSSLSVTAFSESAVAAHAQMNLDKLCEKPIPGSATTIDFTDGLKPYLTGVNPITTADTDVVSSISDGVCTLNTDLQAATTFTNVYRVQFSVYGTVISGELTILGNNAYSVAQRVIDKIPSPISSSLFLPTYDNAAKANLTWISTNTAFLTNDGVFLPNGYQILNDWTSQNLDIGLIVEVDGTRYAAVFVRECEFLSAEERTRLLYDYASLTLDLDDEDTPAIREDLYRLTDHFDDSLLQKLGYASSKIVIDTQDATAQNPNYTGVEATPWYAQYYGAPTIVDGDTRYTELQMLVKPTSIGALVVPANLSFYYTNTSGTSSDYSTGRPLMLLGTNKITTLDDPTDTLQQDFTENKYLQGDGTYSFLADGSYNNGTVLVDYSLDPNSEWVTQDRLEVVNGLFVENETGPFYRTATGAFALYEEGATPAGTQRYDRKSLVIVKPENLSMVTDTAHITAHLIDNAAPASNVYTNSLYLGPLDVSGTVYIEDWGSTEKNYVLEDGEPVSYDLTMVVEGIYHQRPTEIADGNLYAFLCRYYDKNADGYISISEAVGAPITGTTELYTPYVGPSIEYLDFTGAGVTNLKGIEYFVNVTGLHFGSGGTGADNAIVDISYLSALEKLAYLNMADNSVADIFALRYLDNLVYINFENATTAAPNNNITDLAAIQYLPNVQYLDFSDNNNLSDVEPIANYTGLYYLDVRTTSLLGVFNQYYLTLIYDANAAHFTGANTGLYYVHGSSGAYVPSSDLISAAGALANLTVVDETYNTLILKTTENYDGNNYYFEWVSSSDYLSFSPAMTPATPIPHTTTAFSITSPLVDVPVQIIIYVDDATTDYDTIARRFNTNVLQLSGLSNMSYIEGSDGKVYLASELVPDIQLRSLLYGKYNYAGADTSVPYYGTNAVYIDTSTREIVPSAGADTVTAAESNILSQAEIAYMAANVTDIGVLSYGSSGIQTLTGISNFAGAITSLDLRGNTLHVDAATGYPDISELSALDGLSTLYLSGQSYDFTQLARFSETAPDDWTATYTGTGYGAGLTTLQNLSVYGCYALDQDETLSALYQVYLMNKNVDIYMDAAYGTEGAVPWDPYEIPVAVYLNSLPDTFTYVDLTGPASFERTGMYLDENGVMRLNVTKDANGYYCYEFYFYNTLHIKFHIASASTYVAGGTVSAANIQPVTDAGSFVTGFDYHTLVGFTLPQFSKLHLNGREGISFVQDAQVGRNETVSGTRFVEQCLEFNHHIKLIVEEGGEAYSLNELFPGRTLLSQIMSNYAPGQGLRVRTPAGTSQYLTGAAGEDGDIIFTLGDNLIYTTDNRLLSVSGLFLAGGESSVQGLQYTDATTLTIQREAILGNGEWLQNLHSLYIGYAAVDLSSLTMELPNLINLTIGKYYGTAAARGCWHINLYDSSAYNISDTNSQLYDCIVGLDDAYADTVYDDGVTVTSAFYDTNSLQKEAIVGSPEDSAVYAALRSIARSRNTSGNYNFYLNYLPNLQTLDIANTTMYDWTGIAGLLFSSDAAASNYDANHLAVLNLYGSSSFNANGGVCEPIVRKLYQAYFATHGVAPQYRIGTIDNHESNILYDINTWHSNAYLHDENYELYDASRTKARELSEFASSVLDLGVKLGDTLHYNHTTQSVAPGTVLSLPATTEHVMFGTDTDAQFLRDFPITWKDAAGNAVTGTPGADGCYKVTLTAGANNRDKYTYYVGTLNGKSYYYPVLVEGSAATVGGDFRYAADAYSYGVFDDLQLRLAMFLLASKSETFDPTAFTDQLQMSIAPDGTLTLSATGNAVSLGAYPNITEYLRGVATLDGMEILTGLKGVTMENLHIVDASALGSIAGLTSIKLNENLVRDVSWMRNLSSLATIELNSCPLYTAHDGTGSFFPASTVRLSLAGCGSIDATDVATMNTLLALQELYLDNTKAARQEAVIQELYDILDAAGRTGTGLILRLSDSGNITGVTKAALQALMNFLDASTTSNAMFQKLLTPTTGARFTIGSSDTFPVESGVTFTVLNENIYSGGNWSPNVYSYCDFAMEVKFGNFAGVNFRDFAVLKTVYVNFADRVNAPSLRFYSNSANTIPVDIAYNDLDHNVYMYLTTAAGNNWSHSPDGNYTYIVFPYRSERAITINSDLGVQSLKGIERIPNLKTVTVKNNDIETLGFAQQNSSITTMTLGSAVMKESAFASIANLRALRNINLQTVTGIDYETPISGSSSLADLLASLAAPASMNIQINNEYNFINTAAGATGIRSDARFFDSASAGTFGGHAISAYKTGGASNLGLTGVWRPGSETVWKTHNNRSHLSEVYSNRLWWKNNTYANVFRLNTMSKFGTGTHADGYGSLIRYLSQIRTNVNGILPLPETIYYADYAGSDPDLVRTSVSFLLPKSFALFSEDYNISWTAGKLIDPSNNDSSTTAVASLLTDNGTHYTLTFSADDPAALAFEDGDRIKITGTVPSHGSASHIFTISRDESADYYQPPITNGDTVTSFYLEMEDGEIVLANQFFPSYRFLFWIYNHNSYAGSILRDTGGQDIVLSTIGAGGYTGKFLTLPAGTRYLSYESVRAAHHMQTANSAEVSANQGIGCASYEGIQLFANLKRLTIYQGYLTGIEPLKNLQLTEFAYMNSNLNASNVIIQDWTPLYNSRGTLQTFIYARDAGNVPGGDVYNEDFSFLMSFDALQDVQLGVASHHDNINEIQGFRYMLSWFYLNNIGCSVTFNGTQVYNSGSYHADAILVETVNAAQILKDFRALDDSGINYLNNFELSFGDSATVGADGSVSAKLPSYINHGGKLYPLEWVSMSSFVNLTCVDALGNPIAASVDPADSASDTEDDIYFNADAKNYTWTLHLRDSGSNYLGTARVIARIMTDDGIFERVFTINTFDEFIYPELVIWSNFGSYASQDARVFTADAPSAAYYDILTNANGQSVLVLHESAVGQDVYVNYGGVKTKIISAADTTWYTSLATLHGNMMTDYASIGSIDSDYGIDQYSALRAKVDAYENISIGEWIYMEYVYGDDIDAMNAITAALRARLDALDGESITVIYHGAGVNYTNNPANLDGWNAAYGSVALQPPTKSGAVFISWYTDAQFTAPIQVLSYDSLHSFYTAGSVTLYARFFTSGAINYTTATINANTSLPVSFNANNPATFYPSTPITLEDPTQVDSGYTFTGWFLDSGYTTPITQVTAANFIFGTTVNPTLTLYAGFSAPKTIHYSFPTGDGLSNPNNPATYTSGTIRLNPLVITGSNYDGKVFVGWYDAATGGNKVRFITDTLFDGGNTATLYARFIDGYFYLALNTYTEVATYATRNSAWTTGTICYRMDSTAAKDKVQINGVNATLNAFYSATDLGEWYISSAALPAFVNTTTDIRWDGATDAVYTNGASYPTAVSGSAVILRCGSYRFTLDYDPAAGTGLLAADYSRNGTSFETAYAGASSYTSADRDYSAAQDASYAYGFWGNHNSGYYGTYAQLGTAQVRRISYNDTTGNYTTSTMNWAAPNRYFTFLYLTTTADGRDIYALRTANTGQAKVWQAYSDVEYIGTTPIYLDIDDKYNYNLPSFNTPVVRKSYYDGICFNAFTNITSNSDAATYGCAGTGQFANGKAGQGGNFTSWNASGTWFFFCPQGYTRSTATGDNIYSYLYRTPQSATGIDAAFTAFTNLFTNA